MKPHWANAPSLGSCDSHLALTTNTKHFYNNNIDPLELFPFKIEAFQTFLIFLLCSPLWYPVGWPYFALCYHIVVSSWCYPVKSSASADGLVAVSQLRFLFCRGWTARSWAAAPLDNENPKAGVLLQWCQDMLRHDMLWEEPREEKNGIQQGFQNRLNWIEHIIQRRFWTFTPPGREIICSNLFCRRPIFPGFEWCQFCIL